VGGGCGRVVRRVVGLVVSVEGEVVVSGGRHCWVTSKRSWLVLSAMVIFVSAPVEAGSAATCASIRGRVSPSTVLQW
jgi:hypothetical protein